MHVGCQVVDTYRARRENNASQIIRAVFKQLDTGDLTDSFLNTNCENHQTLQK